MTSDQLRDMLNELQGQTSGGGTHGPYQDVLENGRVIANGHRRTLERFERFGLTPDDVAGKHVLDLGCNLGQIAGYYGQWSAESIGIDQNPVFIKWAQVLNPKTQFVVANIDHLTIDPALRLPTHHFEYVFALSVWDYVNHDLFVKLLRSVANGTLFFEGHKADPPYTQQDQLATCHQILEQIGVHDICHLGWVDGDQRPVFRADFS